MNDWGALITRLLEFRSGTKRHTRQALKLVNSSNAIVHIELCGGAQFRVELRKSVLVIGDFSDAGNLRLLIFDVYQRSL